MKWQARLAGDVAFFLRNYELAGEYYRSALADFKHAKDWKKAAAVEEALGESISKSFLFLVVLFLLICADICLTFTRIYGLSGG